MDIACWCHLERDFKGSDEETRQRMDQAMEGGINILLPFIHSRGNARYRTRLKYESVQDTFSRVLALAKERGIEVHPVVLPISAMGISDQEKVRRSYFPGKPGTKPPGRQMCASWKETRDTGVLIVSDIMENYDVDGIHLDGVRYHDTGESLEHPCQCEACRQKYMELLGMDTVSPEDLKVPGILHKFIQFREDNIHEMVLRIRDLVKPKGIKLSMASRAHYLGTPLPLSPALLERYFGTSRKEEQDWGKFSSMVEGQDWVAWAHEGLMDYICPMNYSTDSDFHLMRLKEQLALVKSSAPIYDGIGRKSSVGEISPSEMVKQAEDAMKAGAAGIAIFHFNILGNDDFRELAAFKRANS